MNKLIAVLLCLGLAGASTYYDARRVVGLWILEACR
jgi:hypothetical protein